MGLAAAAAATLASTLLTGGQKTGGEDPVSMNGTSTCFFFDPHPGWGGV